MIANLFSQIRSVKLLLGILIIFYCFANYSSAVAQVKRGDPNTPLPSISNEVFQTIAQFYEYDRNIPLNARIISTDEFQGSIREKIVFIGVNNSKVPAYLIIPKDEAQTHPIVFLVDGIYGSKERWLDDNSWPKGGLVTKALLRSGFAVMALDAVFHGERSFENEYIQPPWPYQYPHKARHMIIQTSIEYRRALDYLSTRKDIDTAKIGMMGLSMGGLITFGLTSLDPRIKSAIAGLTPIWKETEFQPVMPYTFASRVQCNSFLMFVGNRDRVYTMKDAYQLYELIPINQKEFVEYEVDHRPPVEYAEKVTDWFLKNLLY
jgi:dienelactone hydrolase